MEDEERTQYESTIAALMETVKARNTLIAELERELAALRERLAGEQPN